MWLLTRFRRAARETNRIKRDKVRLIWATKTSRIFRWKSHREYRAYREFARDTRTITREWLRAHARLRVEFFIHASIRSCMTSMSRHRAILSDINESRLDKWADRERHAKRWESLSEFFVSFSPSFFLSLSHFASNRLRALKRSVSLYGKYRVPMISGTFPFNDRYSYIFQGIF